MCPREDLNLHFLRNTPLKRARLPVSPLGQFQSLITLSCLLSCSAPLVVSARGVYPPTGGPLGLFLICIIPTRQRVL